MNDGSVGGPSGVPGRGGKPLLAPPRVPNPGQSDFGPPAPYPVTCTMTSFGLAAARLSYSRPHLRSVDGLRFMISTSACRVSDRSRSRPASSRRLRVTHFLLRATLFHISPIPSRCAPHGRSGSPPLGCSTLMTSAPCSPIQVAISGPAARVAASITRNPARAPSVTANSLGGGTSWGGQPGALGGGRRVRRRGACLPGYAPVFILRVTRLAGLQSKVPGLVGSTRCHVPFTSCTSTEQSDEARAPMLTGPMMPSASNDVSSLLSALNRV